MGFFSGIKRSLGHQEIERNGLSRSSSGQNCESCRYRMEDQRRVVSSGYFVCYVHKVKVGSSQICDQFSSGSPDYVLK